MKLDIQQYSILQQAYDYFNRKLFNSELPDVFFILNYRKSSYNGYFHFRRLGIKERSLPNRKIQKITISIIALNPDNFDRPNIDILATLVHEMCHVWRAYKFEKQSAGNYHCKKWANKMESIDLIPSHDGTKTGKKTGTSMHHYIKPGGLFEIKANNFINENNNIFLLEGIRQINTTKAANRNKMKYTCKCGQKIYGQPGLDATCNLCESIFESYE